MWGPRSSLGVEAGETPQLCPFPSSHSVHLFCLPVALVLFFEVNNCKESIFRVSFRQSTKFLEPRQRAVATVVYVIIFPVIENGFFFT